MSLIPLRAALRETFLPCGAFHPVMLLTSHHFVLNAASLGGMGGGMSSPSQLQLFCDCIICRCCNMFCSTWRRGWEPISHSFISFFQHLEQRWVARLRKGLCVCQGTGCGISDLCCLKFAMALRTPTLACLEGGDLSARGFLGSPKATPCAVCLSWLCHVWFVRKAVFKCSCCHAWEETRGHP